MGTPVADQRLSLPCLEARMVLWLLWPEEMKTTDAVAYAEWLQHMLHPWLEA